MEKSKRSRGNLGGWGLAEVLVRNGVHSAAIDEVLRRVSHSFNLRELQLVSANGLELIGAIRFSQEQFAFILGRISPYLEHSGKGRPGSLTPTAQLSLFLEHVTQGAFGFVNLPRDLMLLSQRFHTGRCG